MVVRAGASVVVSNNEGKTVMNIAEEQNRAECLPILRFSKYFLWFFKDYKVA